MAGLVTMLVGQTKNGCESKLVFFQISFNWLPCESLATK